MKQTILVVDDEKNIRASLQGVLEDEGFKVETVPSGEACLETLKKRNYDLVLLDVWLDGGIDGLETLRRIQTMEQHPPVVMISGHGNIETAVKSTKLGAFDFIEKPLSIDKVTLVLHHALEQRRLAEQNEALRRELKQKYTLIGESIPMRALRQQLAVAAPTNGRVLIYGESGTGKELIAHALHQQSLRVNESFVEVNCAAIPEELIESELFGHVKGSFTGATEDKTGKFQQADRGTLFLDEIGDMSFKTQAKVLRVLETQRFARVGGSELLEVDVRVIAATNKNIDEEIARGTFREDLFYRLNVIPFYVPSLRERTEDIPVLARYFVAEFSREYGWKEKVLTNDAIEVLMNYSWPGNVRELKNLMERVVIMTPVVRIEAKHLPAALLRDNGSFPEPGNGGPTLEAARKAYERNFILRKLDEYHGNITHTAKALGVERSHLYRKMKALRIRT
ncbi:MAG: sigma-54 dependent transcriptional regulator [Acidobacteriia bacterium]|nr:sigma-54 dependent transcriptional regulator [Terriglobia bacterium]